MLTYSHANRPLGQSERAYYLSYFLKPHKLRSTLENKKKQQQQTKSSKTIIAQPYQSRCCSWGRSSEARIASLRLFNPLTPQAIVCYTGVSSVVTQRSSPQTAAEPHSFPAVNQWEFSSHFLEGVRAEVTPPITAVLLSLLQLWMTEQSKLSRENKPLTGVVWS